MENERVATGDTMVESANVQMVRALDGAWVAMRALHPDLPAVRIALPSYAEQQRRNLLGHHMAGGSIAGELAVYPNALVLSGEELLGVLLHEGTHSLCAARGLVGTAPSRRARHNSVFERVAAEMGLYLGSRPADMGPDAAAPATLVAYADVVVALQDALDAYKVAYLSESGTTDEEDVNFLVGHA